MRAPSDILDDRERLRQPLVASCLLHAGLVTTLLLGGLVVNSPRILMGDPTSMGGAAYAVNSVSTIPMPASRGPANPLANDTPSQIPDAVKPQPRQAAPAEDERGIPMKGRKTPRKRAAESFRPVRKLPPLELPPVTSSTGAQSSTPLFAPSPGSGGVGVGTGAPFGQRFGGYAALLRDKVARFWRTDDVDARMKSAPEIVVTFEILRNGTVRNVRLEQRSGILALDNSAQRAIFNAAPFPELPPGFERDAAQIEFRFQLKR
jgi:periplasmic protein TonB